MKIKLSKAEPERELLDLEEPFEIDGVIYDVLEPTPNQLALFFEGIGGDPGHALAAVNRFLSACIQAEGYKVLRRAIENEQVDYDTLYKLAYEIIEAATDNPTGSPRDYLPSQRKTGQGSTASSRRPAATRRRSPSTDS